MKHVDTIILVKDLGISSRFYREVIGLEILHDWDTMIVFKERFSIHQADKLLPSEETEKFISREKQGRNNVVLYFETDDLEKEYDRIHKMGIPVVHPILDLPWQKIFRIHDPDNHIIEIGAPANHSGE